MKKSLKGIVYATLGLATGCSTLNYTEGTLKEISPENKLYVNLGQVHYLIKKNRFDGEKDLEGLVNTSKTEEAWIFHPRYKIWVEVGHNEQEDSVEFKSGILDKEIIFYHIHPKHAIKGSKLVYNLADQAHKEIKAKIERVMNKEEYIIEEGINLALANTALKRSKLEFKSSMILGSTLPSPRDIGVSITYGVRSSVASEMGIMDIFYLGDMDWEFRKEEALKIEKEYNLVNFQEIGTKYLKQGFNDRDAIQSTVEEINHKFKGRFMFVFRPWNNKIEISRD
jgi:hypothetical protein